VAQVFNLRRATCKVAPQILIAIYAIVKIFLQFFYSRIDNTRLNFTLGIPGMLHVEKF